MTDATNEGGGDQTPNEWMRAAIHGPGGYTPEVGAAPVTTNEEADEHREQSGDDWARGALVRAQGGGDPGYNYDEHLAASRVEAERAHDAHGDHLVAEGEHGAEWEAEAVRLHGIAQAADKYVSVVEADDPDKAANRGKGINQGPMGPPPTPSESAAVWFGRVLDNVSTRRRGGGPSGMGW